jgi:hypothetical protein
MAEVLLWLEALAGLKALYDLLEGVPDYVQSFQKHLREEDTIAEARRVAATFSTYSDDEIRALIKQIDGCRTRFIAQGGGEDRVRCFCSILNEMKEGNGGILPFIDDWKRMHEQFNCNRR